MRAAALPATAAPMRRIVATAGPAVVASVAYMDPGNFATNIAAGTRYGYALLWVVVLANLAAMLFQSLAARLGIATGRNLAELSREHFSPPVRLAMFAAAELGTMATDLAELLGGAIGLSLLLHLPLLAGMVVTALVTCALLILDRRGPRPVELVIGAMVAAIGAGYLVELFITPPDWAAAASGAVIPHLPDSAALTLAVGIVGATVMPHAIYLHSGLMQRGRSATDDAQKRRSIAFSNREVVVALGFAGLVNLAMVASAAAAFHASHPEVVEIESAYRTLLPAFGPAAAGIFLVALMVSGISSSVVGTLAGQVVMAGFLGVRTSVWIRRAVTLLPAFVVVALGLDATRALVLSQVVLSLVLPAPLLALLILGRRREVMRSFRLGNGIFTLAVVVTGAILTLNVVLLLQVAGALLGFLAR